LADSLHDLAAAFGRDRVAAVCRELSKTYEEVKRGSLGELAEWAHGDVRGEITVVVAGYVADGAAADVDFASEVAAREDAGMTRKEAIADVAAALSVAKRDVFDAVVAAKPGKPRGGDH
jgi:16S rRNA (cytidine1402-2'-O)-methyltransferase